MDIKDLAGFSEPAKRLFEIISAGFGRITAPYFTKKTASAKAYEIEQISVALANHKKLLPTSSAEYEDGKLKIVVSADSPSQVPSIIERAELRETHQKLLEQQNVESICSVAFEELSEGQTIPDQKPDPDWAARFFETTKIISSEELQFLWGKILAGEIKKPGSFSLRTLDVLKNISTREAEVFCKLAKFFLTGADKSIFFLDPNKHIFEVEPELEFKNILDLRDAGLILESTPLNLSFKPMPAGSTSWLRCGQVFLLIERVSETREFSIPVVPLTKTGMELCQLITIEPDFDYLKAVASQVRVQGVRFGVTPFLEEVEDGFKHGSITYFEQ